MVQGSEKVAAMRPKSVSRSFRTSLKTMLKRYAALQTRLSGTSEYTDLFEEMVGVDEEEYMET